MRRSQLRDKLIASLIYPDDEIKEVSDSEKKGLIITVLSDDEIANISKQEEQEKHWSKKILLSQSQKDLKGDSEISENSKEAINFNSSVKVHSENISFYLGSYIREITLNKVVPIIMNSVEKRFKSVPYPIVSQILICEDDIKTLQSVLKLHLNSGEISRLENQLDDLEGKISEKKRNNFEKASSLFRYKALAGNTQIKVEDPIKISYEKFSTDIEQYFPIQLVPEPPDRFISYIPSGIFDISLKESASIKIELLTKAIAEAELELAQLNVGEVELAAEEVKLMFNK